jgi:hypothetical protein
LKNNNTAQIIDLNEEQVTALKKREKQGRDNGADTYIQ